jgi:parallel beta-helix repeat protein
VKQALIGTSAAPSKILSNLFILLFSASILTGCLGIGDSDSSSQTGGTTTAPTPDQAPPWSVGTTTNVNQYKQKCPENSIYIGTRNFSTLQAAINAAVSGDVILVGKGNFNENLIISGKKGIKLFSQCQPQIYGLSIKKSQDIEIDGFDVKYKSTNLTGVLIGKVEDDEDDDHDNYDREDSHNEREVSSLSSKAESTDKDKSDSSDKRDDSQDESKDKGSGSDKFVANNGKSDDDHGKDEDQEKDERDVKTDKNANYRITIKNSSVQGFPVKGYGIRISEHNYDITLSNNTVHNNLGNGIFLSPSEKMGGLVLDKNVVTQNGYNGIILRSESKITLTDNVISQNGQANVPSNGYGIKFLGNEGNDDHDKRRLNFSGNYVIYNQGAVISKKATKDIKFYRNIRSSSSSGNFSTAGIENGFGIYSDIETPKIELFNTDHYMTRFAEYLFMAHVTDPGLSSVKAYFNGTEIYSSVVGDIVSLVTLREGTNTFEVVAVDYAGNTSTKKLTEIVLDTIPPVLTQNSPVKDSTLYSKVLPFDVWVNISSDENLTYLKVNQANASILEERTASIQISVQTEGYQSLNIEASDIAGNITTFSSQFTSVKDDVPPVIEIQMADNFLTNQYEILMPIKVTDKTPVFNDIKVNGVLILGTGATDFSANVYLDKEGANNIEVVSTDSAGNQSSKQVTVMRDTTPPILTFNTPHNSDTVNGIEFSVHVSANEPIKNVFLNGLTAPVSEDRLSFQSSISAAQEGAFLIKVEAYDLAGNYQVKEIQVEIRLRALNANLVGIFPDEVNKKLLVRGNAGASRPGLKVTASAGIFNSGSAIADAMGAFTIPLNPFNSVTVKVFDPIQNKTESASFSYGSDTILAGQVREINDVPMPGVTVSIAGSSLSVKTDTNGVFTFSKLQFPSAMVTGDQDLIINGNTANLAEVTPVREFSMTHVAVTIGIGQSNVLLNPIYLAPIYLDDSSTTITKSLGGRVQDIHAPGVVLDIPPGAATFPMGDSVANISIQTISSMFSTVPPPLKLFPIMLLL